MRPQNKTSFLALFLLVSQTSSAQNNETFRTPAKLYAGAYSIKLRLKKGLTEYDVPVWVKPDQAESALDASLLKELGYMDREFIFQDVKIAGENIEKKTFKNMKTEWAFVPDFAKSCCFGVIGRDILENFEVKFSPQSPVHLEWRRLVGKSDLTPYPQKFLTELKKLFSLNRTLEVPFTLNLQAQEVKYASEPLKQKPELFSFYFVPPERVIQVGTLLPKSLPSAKQVGFGSGTVITHINNESVAGLDRWMIEQYLRGQKGDSIKLLAKSKKEFTFDFTSGLFIPAQVPIDDKKK